MTSPALPLSPELDPFRPSMPVDPYPHYQSLREEHPIYWSSFFGGWVLTRYADAKAAISDPRLSSALTRAAQAAQLPAALRDQFAPIDDILSLWMVFQDPPRHLPSHFSRVAAVDLEIRGQPIRAGEQVIAAVGSANHDPAQFPDPERFDIRRRHNGHIAFGHGPHFCLGAPLARLQVEIAFNTLLRRLPELALASEPPVWRDAFGPRALTTLPVTFAKRDIGAAR